MSNLKKYLKLGIWGLKTSFGPLGLKTIKPFIQSPSFSFHKKISHFIHNYKLNPFKLSNLKKYLNLGALGLKTGFGPPGLKIFNKPLFWKPSPNFPEKSLILTRIIT